MKGQLHEVARVSALVLAVTACVGIIYAVWSADFVLAVKWLATGVIGMCACAAIMTIFE